MSYDAYEKIREALENLQIAIPRKENVAIINFIRGLVIE